MKEQLSRVITLLVTFTLCIVVCSMVVAMLVGLFDPQVDNTKIFEIIGPAFQTIVGGFVGLIAGIQFGQKSKDENLQ